MKADLHTHTYCSDGTLSPGDLQKAALQAGLNAISITDHDTLKAYELWPKSEALALISGIELSVTFAKASIHLLAYSFALQNSALQALCLEQVVRREKRNCDILERLKSLGYPLEEQELYFQGAETIGSIGRPHIAQVLMNKGYVSSIREAFDRLIGEDAPAFVSGARCSLEEAVEVIHEAGGFAVVAHPHFVKDKSILRRALASSIDGLEAYYASFGREHSDYFVHMASERGLFVTGGSDFHGETKPQNTLGSSLSPIATVERLLERSVANNGLL